MSVTFTILRHCLCASLPCGGGTASRGDLCRGSRGVAYAPRGPRRVTVFSVMSAGVHSREAGAAAAAGNSKPSVARRRTRAAPPPPEPSLQMVCKQRYRVTKPVFGVPTGCMVLCSLMLMPADAAPSAANAAARRVNTGEDGCRCCRRLRRGCCC